MTMICKPEYFGLKELVCQHVFGKYNERAWMFLDPRLLVTIDSIRERIGKPVFVNNWDSGGEYSQRGLRCTNCEIVQSATKNGALYMSAHLFGRAVDFDVQGLLAEEVRQWIIQKKPFWPYPIRLEDGVSWVHLDVYDENTNEKVYLFKK